MSDGAFTTTLVRGDAARARVNRPYASRLCDGHFPDEPILPGASVIGLMADVAAMLLAKRGTAARLTEIVQVTFLAPIRPDATVELSARLEGAPALRPAPERVASEGTRITVEAHADETLAARGTLRFT